MAQHLDRRSQWLKGLLDLCVLGTLQHQARYGYEIAQLLTESGLGQVKGGTLYPVLGRLEEAGLVESEWRPGDSGPNRKYYELSQEGRVAFTELGAQWQTFVTSLELLIDGRVPT